jgi:hypothetical protein
MSNETKQTAVVWFAEQISSKNLLGIYTYDEMVMFDDLLKQAKEMEKERIETAYNKGTVHGIDYPESTLPLTGEQYYNETYGGNK